MRARGVRAAVAAVLAALVVAVAGAVAAPQAVAVSSPWIPPSWLSSAVGTMAAGRSALQGDTSSFTGSSGWTIADTESYAPIHFVLGGAQRLDLLCRDGTTACANGWGLPAIGISYWADGTATCADGTLVAMRVTNGWPTGTGCASHGGSWTHFHQDRWSDATHFVSGFDLDSGQAAGPTLTTELWCRPVDGGDDVHVSETGAPGGVAPAPVCPSGTVSIRVRITDSVKGVIQDTSMSTNWDQWSQYISGGGGTAVPGMGGVPCVVGGPCDDWWTKTTPAPSNADCWTQMADMTLFSVAASDCQDANNSGNVKSPTDSGETSNNTDLNPIIRVISAGVAGIVNAVNAVKSVISSVKSLISTISKTVSGIAKTVSEGIANIIGAIGGVVSAITQGVSDIINAISSGINRIMGAIACTNGACDGLMSQISNNMSQMVGPDPGPVSQWSDVATSYVNVFGNSGCSCAGLTVHLNVGADVQKTVVIADSCSGWLAELAGITRLVSRVVAWLGAAAAVMRYASLALSYGPMFSSFLARHGDAEE